MLKASLYVFIDLSNRSLSDEDFDSLFSIDFGNFLRMLGEWLGCIFRLIGLLFLLRNGLFTFSSELSVTSRKSTVANYTAW